MVMLNRNMLYLALGGLALTGVMAVVVGVTVHRQTTKLKSNIRTVSRGIYNFGTALQLLSGAATEDECECCNAG